MPISSAQQSNPAFSWMYPQQPAGSSAVGGTTPSGGGAGYSIGTVNGQGGIALPNQPGAPNVNLNQQGVNVPSTQWDAYQKLLQSPGDVTSNPAYQFLQQQGQQAMERQIGQSGQRFSGNALTAAQQYGQGLAGQYFGQLTNTLGNAAQLELSRYLQPAQAQAGLNVNAGQLANQNWANYANTALGAYNAATGAAQQANNANQQQYLNQASQQGYQNLMPTVQNIAAQLSGPSPAGAQYGYSPSNPSPAELASQTMIGGGQGWSTYG